MSALLIVLSFAQLAVLVAILLAVAEQKQPADAPLARVGQMRRDTVEALLAAEAAERQRYES